jgi:branched-chain amino acid transport system ATP-binding protein
LDRARRAAGARLADRVFVMHYGKELAVGAPDDVLRDPRVVQAYIGV